jgi:hypothetical protein
VSYKSHHPTREAETAEGNTGVSLAGEVGTCLIQHVGEGRGGEGRNS